MAPAAVVAVFAVGLAVGLLSGLVGIGGGVLIVPFLYFYYAHPALFGVEVAPQAATVVAHATSLFIIVPTSFRGALTFHRAGLVVWRAVWPIGMAAVVAAVAAARVATLLPPQALRVAFGALLVFSGVRLLFRRSPEEVRPAHELCLSPPVTVAVGAVVGAFSALLGVGGGVVAIPLLLYVVGIDVRQVAATSMGVVAVTSVAGVLAYAVGGIGAAGRPPWSVGYVDVAVGTVMFLGALLSVGWGAALNQRLDPRTLGLAFAVLFVLLGGRLVLENLGAF